MSKPKILVCVLTGAERTNWINPDLSMNLLQMVKDPRFDVNYYPVRDARPWEVARNMTIQAARQIGADWLISFDNDNFTQGNPLDIIAAAGNDKHVIGLTYGVTDAGQYGLFPHDGHGASDGPFREEVRIGGEVLMIRNIVWQRIPNGPWFRWHHAENENGAAFGEDVFFCNLVRRHGIRVWTHQGILAGHYRTVNITEVLIRCRG